MGTKLFLYKLQRLLSINQELDQRQLDYERKCGVIHMNLLLHSLNLQSFLRNQVPLFFYQSIYIIWRQARIKQKQSYDFPMLGWKHKVVLVCVFSKIHL